MPNMGFFQVNVFSLLARFFKSFFKFFQIQGPGCYNINVTFLSSPKDDLLNLIKFEFQCVFIFGSI